MNPFEILTTLSGNSLFYCLIAVMIIDTISGLACSFRGCSTSSSKTFKSQIMKRGITEKVLILCVVGVCHLIDIITNTPILFDVTCAAYIISESLSVVENADAFGVPLPEHLSKIVNAAHKIAEEHKKDK